MIKVSTIKNGAGWLVIHDDIDESKPKCYLDGFQYKFNTTEIKREYIQEFRKAKNGNHSK